MEETKTRIIAVANEKGGVGKTSMVINLGAALSLQNKSVLIVDMDPQCNATYSCGIKIHENMISTYDLITNSERVSASDAVIKTRWDNLSVIPGHMDLVAAELELLNVSNRENKLYDTLTDIADHYDFILLDTPPSLNILSVNVFSFATEVVVPCQTQPYSFSALCGLFDTINTIKEEINPDLEITGIAATFFDKRKKINHKILDKLKNTDPYKNIVFKTTIRDNSAIPLSCEENMPVVFFDIKSSGAKDYINLSKELIEEEGE